MKAFGGAGKRECRRVVVCVRKAAARIGGSEKKNYDLQRSKT
jgi:hypothetical protein